MATAHDVAAYILQQRGEMTTWKLQKLVYYSQAWQLVWAEQPMFDERIEAWANGPVVPDLYREHAGKFKVSEWPQGNPDNLTDDEKDSINEVLGYYGDKTGQWLSELTHQERPWREARDGLLPTERGQHEITLEAMAEYYGSLISDGE